AEHRRVLRRALLSGPGPVGGPRRRRPVAGTQRIGPLPELEASLSSPSTPSTPSSSSAQVPARGAAAPAATSPGASAAASGAAPGPPPHRTPRLLAAIGRDPLAAAVGLYRRYGDRVRVPVPGHPLFLLCHPAHAEHVLVSRESNYRKAATYRPLRI